MLYTYTQFGSVTLPTANPKHPVGPGAARLALSDLVSGGAFNLLGTGTATPGQVPIALTVDLDAPDVATLQTAADGYRALVGTRQQLWRQPGNPAQAAQWTWAILADLNGDETADNVLDVTLTFLFVKVSPTWYGIHHDDVTTLNTNPKAFSVVFGSGIAGPIAVRNAVVQIHAGSSNITSVTLRKDRVGGWTDEWTFSGTIVAGTTLVIDVGAGTVYNDGVSAYSGLATTTNHQEDAWLVLEPGGQTLTVTRTGGGTDSTIELIYDEAQA